MSAAVQPIAVVGVSAIFPGSVDKTGFWNDILTGRDLVRDVPSTHWLKEDYFDPDPAAPDKTYAYRGAFLDGVPFDPMEWGVPPSIVPATDTTQLLALIVARKVLEDATRGRWPEVDKERISCILGVTSAQELLGTMVNRLQRPVWANALRGLGYAEAEVDEICQRIADHYVPWQESTFPGLLGNVVAGRIANRLDLGGTNCVTDAACASSFSAMAMAVNELHLDQSDLVICGGADTMNDIFMYMCFSKTPALSKSGDCRPFSDKADGTLLGEGLGMVALKRLADAERDGDHVYAVLRGLGSSSDGRSKSVYAPVPQGQAKALRRAYAQAGYGPDTVDLVEAHGTGTKAGDAAEFDGLKLAFDESGRADRQWCALGTVKSQIGHTKAAAGAAGLFKIVMALHHKVLPPTIKVDSPNPKLHIEESPFYLNTRTRPWIRPARHPRRASVSSFGFGGSNFHLTLEEYDGPAARAPKSRSTPSELVVLSDVTPSALATRARALADRATLPGFLAFAARSTQEETHTGPARLAVVASSEKELATKLRQLAERIDKVPDETFVLPTGSYYAHRESPGEVAFLFSGQGSQYLHMGADVVMTHDAARAAFDAASSLDLGPLPLSELIWPRPGFGADEDRKHEDRLRATECAQPAIGAISLALLGVMTELGVTPAAVAGHSYGEITALHAAGVLSADDTLRIARRRGVLMSEAASASGAMTAIPRPIDEARRFVEAVPGVVVANHNAPAQVVASGPTEAVAELEKRLHAAGIEPKRLSVATAFHSPVVAPSVEPFRAFLADVSFASPTVPVWSNAEARPYPSEPDAIRARVAEAVALPVRFVEQVEGMYASGIRTFVEVGPGSVLANLVSDCLEGRPHVAVSLDRRKKNSLTALHCGLGRLFVAGLPLRLERLWTAYERPVDPHTVPVSKISIRIDGSNHAKPYPPKGGAKGRAAPNPARTGFAKSKDQGGPAQVQIVEKVVERIVEKPVPVPVPVTPSPNAGVVMSKPEMPQPAFPVDPWVLAFQEAQRATVEAHAAYQRSMAQSHEQFLRTLEQSFVGLAGMMGVPTAGMHVSQVAPMPMPMPAMPMPMPAMPMMPTMAPMAAPQPQLPMWATAPAAAPAPATVPVQSGLDLVRPAPAAPAPSPRPAPAAAAAVDVEALLMEVVAEKTGYPAEMLAPHMALEADLGVDSIKRVEILSAVRERAPGLPEVDAGEMAKLQTLGQVVDHLRQSLPVAPARPPAPSPEFVAPRPSGAPVAAVDVEALLMEVVAEKTGYPAEMLAPHMALEADLGVDSIKRVEILSAVRERAPGLPEVDAGEMAKLQTLGQVVDHLRQSLPSAPATSKATAAPSAPAASAAAVDVEALLMDVVAEKTGYPAEMLARHMALEADLGVDSIKRVEILSAVRERAPGLPEVDASEMAKLQTLGQVVDHLRATLPAHTGAPVVVQSLSRPTAAPEAPPIDPRLGRWTLALVPSPATGMGQPGLSPKARVTLTPPGPLAEAVRAALAEVGVKATSAATVPPDADVVVFLGGLQADASPSASAAVHRAAFVAAKSVAPRFSRDPGLFVTVQDTGGDFGLSGSDRAWLGGLQGLVKTAAQEWPKAHLKAVDLQRGSDDDDAVARRLVAELLAGGDDLEVGLRVDGTRLVPRSVRGAPEPGPVPFPRDTVIVATGGARGVTAHTLIALARAHGGRYALLGRTPLEAEPASVAGLAEEPALKRALLADATARGEKVAPAELGRQVSRILANREVRATLDALRAAGAEARYVPCDVNDPARLQSVLAEIRAAWGPIGGLVHGAGVLADKLVADKSVDQWNTVFDTKVAGLITLLDALAADPLRVMVMFASVAGRCGNRGQSDYAAANEVLAKVAAQQARLRPGCVVKALQWGPWEGGMVTPQLARQFAAMGVPLIPLDVGARWLVEELGDRTGNVEIVLGNEPLLGPLAGHSADATAGQPQEHKVTLRLRLSPATHPHLADHEVGGVPVVPVVLALEWFARAAAACRPDLSLASIRDVKVLRGLKLDHFADGEWLDVSARETSNGDGAVLALELSRVGGALHYTAQARMVAQRAAAPSRPQRPRTEPFQGEVYDGAVLFHGPRFHVIRSVDGIGDDGLVATLATTSDMSWPAESWRTDPAAFDGGLQLALIWTRRVLGGPSLPMGVGALHTFVDGVPAGPLTATLRGEKKGRDRTVTQVVFADAGGGVVARLEGVEAILRPDAR